MGKKSRLKRERRRMAENNHLTMLSRCLESHRHTEANFTETLKSLENYLSKFNAEDVCIAINISHLWLPNISSQVKHVLALRVFSSMQTECFDLASRIDTYALFSNFTSQLYKLLPQFPMLEDYVPECDWGEVKIEYKGKISSLFYGCEIERITDFIECFKFIAGSNASAHKDMRIALDVQDYIIANIDRSIVGYSENIERGHIEVPSEHFWKDCLTALTSIPKAMPSCQEVSKPLIISQGSLKSNFSMSDFSELIMTGKALPALFIDIGGKQVPVAIRSMPGAILTYWEKRIGGVSPAPDGGITRRISSYIAHRIDHRNIFAGPFVLRSKTYQSPCKFSAALLSTNSFTLVVALHPNSIKLLQQVELTIQQVLTSGEDWALFPEDEQGAIQFRHPSGRLPQPSEVSILLIIAYSSTIPTRIELPKNTARVMFLSEFISIFDSLKSVSELNKFWEYEDKLDKTSLMSMGLVDLFASFRDSYGVLIDGALAPTHITIDPHWNANWRFRELSEYWSKAPTVFPNDSETCWELSASTDGLLRLAAKDMHQFAYLALVNNCHVYCMFSFDDSTPDAQNSKLLELFVHCVADSISQMSEEFKLLPLFARKRIVTWFSANKSHLTTEHGNAEDTLIAPLLDRWKTSFEHNNTCVLASVSVNLDRVQSKLLDTSDASFEIECIVAWADGLSTSLGNAQNNEIFERLKKHLPRMPRFLLTESERKYDVPDHSSPRIPEPGHYKLARRDLAIVFKDIGVEPGRYELLEAKQRIDAARDHFRKSIHAKIASFNKQKLLQFCIEQLDALSSGYHSDEFRLQQSLKHEVSYDRSKHFADTHSEYIQNSKNYRYILECCLSMPTAGTVHVETGTIVELVAQIDWLTVLYNASDVLHNGIDVGGVTIDSSYIPEVFYSEVAESTERKFEIESANFKLKIGLDQGDEVSLKLDFDSQLALLDPVFVSDVGFSLSHLLQTFAMLSHWCSRRGNQEFSLCYHASKDVLLAGLLETIEGLSFEEASNIIEFITLKPNHIRRLLGKSSDEVDVPVWEHTKRESRYSIKPLVQIENDIYFWGAAAAYNSFNIWWGSISEGYLPADFPWPKVKTQVRAMKAELETQLEKRASQICSRFTPHVAHGVDFKYKFPEEGFDDVGDYDVLAYWPEANFWLTIECKYNQPPFCLKDARRLRDRIFGISPDRGQFAKIERRRTLLESQSFRLASLLGWPSTSQAIPASFLEVYASLSIYWWMRRPPYKVPTHFVRIDALDNWLKTFTKNRQARQCASISQN